MDGYEEESNAKKYVIIGVLAGLVLLLVGIGIFVIVKRRSAGDLGTTTVPSGSGAAVNVNSSGSVNEPPPFTVGGGQAEAPIWTEPPVVSTGPIVSPVQDATSPTVIDPTTNRLLTAKEKAMLGYPADWDVRAQAFKSTAGTVFLIYTVENRPADQDDDGLSDTEERQAGTDPKNPDTDGDTLTDRQEVKDFKTDPLKKDTDGDGVSDDVEIMKKTDPLDPKSL